MKKHARKNNKIIRVLFLLLIIIAAIFAIMLPVLNKEKTMHGTIKAVSEQTVTIMNDDQHIYIFNREKTMFEGDPVEVNGDIELTYKGHLKENEDTVQKVRMIKATITLPTHTIQGIIESEDADVVFISNEEGTYGFKIAEDRISGGQILAENQITVTYRGTLDSGQPIQNVILVSMEIKEVDRYYEGTIIEANEDSIAIRADDGSEYLFSFMNVRGDNVIVGYDAKVTYHGKISDTHEGVQDVAIQFIDVTKVDLGNLDPIIALMNQMSAQEKIGQMFMARCPKEEQTAFVEAYQIGGYILFGRDFENKTAEEVIQNIASYQSISKFPLLIGTDEEGGTVNRVSRYFCDTPFLSPQALFNQGGMQAILQDVDEKSRFLQGFGINVNFAPVADVSTNSKDFIYDRSFGKSASEDADYVGQVVWRMKQNRMGSVLKHFPGYGNNGDTHTNICYDERSYDTFTDSDFLPFLAGIENGAECLLVNHNIVTSMDSVHPASLSLEVHSILRNDLGFDKVIITDDLAMDGVADYADSENIAVMAILAGNDMLLTSDAPQQIEAVEKAVQDGTISIEQINASVERILRWKYNLGLL
mgnify:FL=1